MARVQQISDKFFARDDTTETLTEFTDRLLKSETLNNKVGLRTDDAKDFTINGNDVYRFLQDTGTGRIYEGLKSLELMSRTIKGTSIKATSLFDTVIIAFSADDMKNATVGTSELIVNSNLGMTDIRAYAVTVKSTELAAYDLFIATIAKQIKAGGFKTEDHINQALIRVKALIKSVLNIKR